MRHIEMIAALKSWRVLNHALFDFTEEEVLAMLGHEKSHSRRQNILERLHARYNSLRVARERIDLLGGADHG